MPPVRKLIVPNPPNLAPWRPPAGVSSVRVLVVGGGGSGATSIERRIGGTGGASGEVVATQVPIKDSQIWVRGGRPGNAGTLLGGPGGSGGSSSFGILVAAGGDGVVAVDCGANIGVHAISWARRATSWRMVYAIEAQERIFHALAGNIALNNCFNVRAIHAAVAAKDGVIRIPTPDYGAPGSFGSLELRQRPQNEFIGQRTDYSEERLTPVKTIALDGLRLRRLDFLKIDVEGMEVEVLEGARNTIAEHRPVILVEHIKLGSEPLAIAFNEHGYDV